MSRAAAGALLGVALLTAGCTRNAADAAPTVSAGVPPAVSVAVVDFPSAWVADRVGGDAIDLRRTVPSDLGTIDTDLVAYVPGVDPDVDAAVATLPGDRVVDLTDDVGRLASPRDPNVKDPYVWFDPVNIAAMAQTLATAMGAASPTEFVSNEYYGVRALRVQAETADLDQRLQEMFNPCRIPTLVVEAPVLTYLARAYAFTQVPLVSWRPREQDVTALYYTVDAEPAVREAADAAGVSMVAVDTLTQDAPQGDLLQGVLDTALAIADEQDCPLVRPTVSERPG